MSYFFGRFRGVTYAAMRIVLGFLYLSHGLRWLFGTFGGEAVPLQSLFGAAGLIETVCGTLIAVGFLTGPAAFIASGEMAVAYYLTHAPQSPWPIQNGGEITVALCFAFLYISTHGPGIFSVDWLIRRNDDSEGRSRYR
jgi:putative oxidoreductase